MGVDCKSTSYAYAGSNPAWPTIYISPCPCGSVVEHTLGKGEVTSSILVMGFLATFTLLLASLCWVALFNDAQTTSVKCFIYFVNQRFIRSADFAAGKY